MQAVDEKQDIELLWPNLCRLIFTMIHYSTALQCMGRNPSDKAVERYWSQCGGSMSYDQFCFVMQREKRTTMSDLMKSFRKIDINGDGYITAKELHRMLTKV